MKLLLYIIYTSICIFSNSFISNSQSIHQSQLEYYNSLGQDSANYYETDSLTIHQNSKVDCNLIKKVYGWHPYWIGNAYQNYQWDLLSHLCFFSYEVDYISGNAITTHGWSTSAAVTAALASGSTKVTFCVTLFANHTSFLTNSTAKQTLITNLISLISSRGAQGVNIDFEGLPSSQSTNFANFMVDLANQMHTAIPNSEVSTVLYSVDWSSVFNFTIMEPEVDNYIIMGYDYYYSGSSTAGPNDPLYQFGNTYNYTLSRSITDYVKAGCPKDKLILGLPNYGREWSTTSLAVPSGTTATGVSRTYSYIQNNSSGFYSAANHSYDNDSESDMYLFTNNGTPKQCFIAKEGAFGKRLQHVLNSGISGIGIWALGYDDGYSELWDVIRSKLTDCYADSCSGTIHDFGGKTKNYYNNEDYTWTIAPPNASSLDVNFTSFDVESNYDFLYIYDGNSTASPQIIGSPFSGTSSPGSFTTSSGAVTFRFTSDISTVRPGFIANYSCNQDDVPPSTQIAATGVWQTQDFDVNYSDFDNSAIQNSFSLITDHDGTQRSANRNLGYLYEDFTSSISNQWTTGLGNWSLASGWLNQSSEVETNSACNSTLTQNALNDYSYHWKGKIGGIGANRRAGIHFFCSDASLPNRGDSYLVYWRADTDKCQIYRSTGDVLVLQTNDNIIVDPNIEYDFKIIYNPVTGMVKAYLDDQLVSSWIDPNPLQSGSSISIRSGECTYTVDDLKVYKSRSVIETITVGNPGAMVRFQNINAANPNCSIYSFVIDDAENFSIVENELLNIDWTSPAAVSVNDGLSSDVDLFVTPTEISANWTSSSDIHSTVLNYSLAIGTTLGGQEISSFTSVGIQTNATVSGLTLSYGQMYYISVKAMNGAGLESIAVCSDGQMLQVASSPPIANFQVNESIICEGDSILLINTSTDGISYLWSTSNGVINSPTAQQTYIIPGVSGPCEVTLVATNTAGSNQLIQTFNFTLLAGPIASAIPDQTNLSLPNAIVLFNNISQNADSYYWEFGDGEISIDQNPWHQYSAIGTYVVMLVAVREGCENDTTYFTINVGHASVIESNNQTINIYPNPFKQSITIEGSQLEEIILYDLQGKLIYLKNLNGQNKIELKMETELESGLYLVKIKDSGIIISKRLVKM